MSLPVLTPEQRADALAKAAAARKARSEALARIKAGTLTVADVLASDDTVIRKTPVRQVIRAVPGIGDVTADKLMDECGIASNRRVGGLRDRQREALAARFAA